MPHIRILFKSDKVSGETINQLLHDLVRIVGIYFDENPDYVSADIAEQSQWVLNRKDIDIELDASPDESGRRSAAALQLAEELVSFTKKELGKKNVTCEVSSWVRIFTHGQYAC